MTRRLAVVALLACVGCGRPVLGGIRDVGEPSPTSATADDDVSPPRSPFVTSMPSAAPSTTPCIIDPSDNVAKECHHVMAGGACAHFGARCAGIMNPPAGAPGSSTGTCMVDPATSSRRTCHHVTAGGGCAHFGGPC